LEACTATLVRQGNGLNQAVNAQLELYRSIAADQQVVTTAVDELGVLAKAAVMFVQELPSGATQAGLFSTTRILLSLLYGSAAMWLNRLPAHRQWADANQILGRLILILEGLMTVRGVTRAQVERVNRRKRAMPYGDKSL